jgi:Ser/Thr protein kinase RdoA (MazF antagonist)
MLTIKTIEDSYDVKINNLKLLDQYFGTEIYLAETGIGKYIVKSLPLFVPGVENEGPITNFLYSNGIPVARLLQAKNGGYAVKTDKARFHVQEYIEGKIFKLNTAPDWLMEESAHMLGKIHTVLRNYGDIDVKSEFGDDFFRSATAIERKRHYSKQLYEAVEKNDASLASDLEERIAHLDRISTFDIDPTKLTYANTHRDYDIRQIIVKNKDITVIDWTSACKFHIGYEVMRSFVLATPECENGKVNGDALKRYIDRYHKYFRLNDYDIRIMPYLFYFQQMIHNYSPPYETVPETCKPLCYLIMNLTKWLYVNVENLANELIAIK